MAIPAGLYIAVLPIVTLASVVAFQVLGPGVGKNSFGFNGGTLLGGWANWDAGWYYHIANYGYGLHQPGAQSPVAFFPGYAVAMRWGGRLIGDHALAGILITIASGLGSAVAFWTWCRSRMSERAATTSVLALLLYPYAFYLYGAMYGTALFLLATLVAFIAVERNHLVLAGLAGGAATFTRFFGIAVVVGLVVCVLEQRGALRRPRWLGIPTRLSVGALRPRDGVVLLSLSGLAAYAGYLWVTFGDPFMFATVQRHWGQEPGPRTWLKVAFAERMVHQFDEPFTWGLVLQGAIALGVTAMVPLVGRRFGWGYAAYLAVAAVLPILGSKDFHGLGRYVINAFPAFAIVGHHLAEHPTARPVILGISGVGMLGMTAGFAHGLYLA